LRYLGALLPAILMGCAYDWTIGALADAGPDAGAGGRDAGPDCAALETDLDGARAAAKACTLGAGGQCTTSIVDECGCTSYVTEGGSAAASAFAAAVQAVKAAECASPCGTCLVSPGACLLNGGTQAACVP
jgi:hypothetical protein